MPQDANLRNAVTKGLYSGKVVVSSASSLSSVPIVTIDAKHIVARDDLQHWDSNQGLLLEVGSVSAHKRRVHFQKDSQKSKSLETPYHHSHHQQKLNLAMDDITERSSSYSVIPQGALYRGNYQHNYNNYYSSHSINQASIAPGHNRNNQQRANQSHDLNTNRNSSMQVQDPTMLSHTNAERMLRYRQRSFSADDLSPNSVEHIEKWEREAHGDQIWNDKIKLNQNGNDPPKSNNNRLERPRAPMLTQQQRSFSAGDISPSCEKWESESSEQSASEKLDRSCRNARITYMRDKLNNVQASYPVDIQTGQKGHSWGEIMAMLPSGRHTIEKAKQQVRDATLKGDSDLAKVIGSKKKIVSDSKEPEHRTRQKDKDQSKEKKHDNIHNQSKIPRSNVVLSNQSPPDRTKKNTDSNENADGTSAFARYRSLTLVEKRQHYDLHKETAGRRISAPVTSKSSIPGGSKDRRDVKVNRMPLIKQREAADNISTPPGRVPLSQKSSSRSDLAQKSSSRSDLIQKSSSRGDLTQKSSSRTGASDSVQKSSIPRAAPAEQQSPHASKNSSIKRQDFNSQSPQTRQGGHVSRHLKSSASLKVRGNSSQEKVDERNRRRSEVVTTKTTRQQIAHLHDKHEDKSRTAPEYSTSSSRPADGKHDRYSYSQKQTPQIQQYPGDDVVMRSTSTQVSHPVSRSEIIYRERSPGAFAHPTVLSTTQVAVYHHTDGWVLPEGSPPMYHHMRVIDPDISPYGNRRDVSPSAFFRYPPEHHHSVQEPESSPKHMRVRRPKTLVRQKDINAHIRPMDFRGTQEHIKQKRQLMLQQRKSHSFESSFEDHFFHDLKYDGVDLKELKNSAKKLDEVSANKKSNRERIEQSRNAAEKRLLMVKDRTERKSNSLDSSFEVMNDTEIFYDAPSSFIQDPEKSPRLDSARQKRMSQFKEQKSYSYECPTSMEKFHTKVHVRVEDLRNSDSCFTTSQASPRPRRELPVEPGSPSRRRSSGSPRSPQGRGSPNSPRSPQGRGSPHSPRSPSGRGSPRSPIHAISPHSPRSPQTPHSPKILHRKVSPKSSLQQYSNEQSMSAGYSTRERSPSMSHSRERERKSSYASREMLPSGGENPSKEKLPSSSRTQSRELSHHSSQQSTHNSQDQSDGRFRTSPYSSRENSSREASLNKSRCSLNQSKGSINQSREQLVRHPRDKSPYQSHEQSLGGSREYISPHHSVSHFRDISPRGSKEQSLSLSREVSPKTSRDRLNYSRDSNHQSKEHIIRSRELSPYHSRELSPYQSQSDIGRATKSSEYILQHQSKQTTSNDAIGNSGNTRNRRDCFQQQKSYSIDLPPSHDPYVEQERQMMEQSSIVAVRYEGLAPLKEYRESIDSHDEKCSLTGYPSPIAQLKENRSPRVNRRQQFTQQKSYSLDLPCIVREPVYSESEPVESKAIRPVTQQKSSSRRYPEIQPPPVTDYHRLVPQTSEQRRMQLLKQKSKSVDVTYQPTEVKEYMAKLLERRSYDHAFKREYSKDFDAQLKRVMMARRAMTLDAKSAAAASFEASVPMEIVSSSPQMQTLKAHKMRTFREQKSYSIDVPDKSAYEPEYHVRRERSPSQGQAQRPVVSFREPKSSGMTVAVLTAKDIISNVPNISPDDVICTNVPNMMSSSDMGSTHKQKRNMLKQQKSYSLDIPISQVQRPHPEVGAADSGIGASSDRTLDGLIPDIHIEPNIMVLDPESPPLFASGQEEIQAKMSPRAKKIWKQKSYSIDVPPSVGSRYDTVAFEEDFFNDPNHLNIHSDWRKKRQDFFQHQKSYSVDVPSAEMGSSCTEYTLPQRKVESDSKIIVHPHEKRPTHKRLQFLRYLTEQGTFSFDDGGKAPLVPLDLNYVKRSDSSKSILSSCGSNTSLSSRDKMMATLSHQSQSIVAQAPPQYANQNRRKSLFALHNMKALADVPGSGESGESEGTGGAIADESTLLLCDSGVVFDEPTAKEVTIALVTPDKIAHCDRNKQKDMVGVASSGNNGCSGISSAGVTSSTSGIINVATDPNTELKGILKNKDAPIYIKDRDRESSWKWKLFACAEFLTDRRTEMLDYKPAQESSSLNSVDESSDNSNVDNHQPTDEEVEEQKEKEVKVTNHYANLPWKNPRISEQLDEELRRYLLFAAETKYAKADKNWLFNSGRLQTVQQAKPKLLRSNSEIAHDVITKNGGTRSPGSRRRKRLTHHPKSFSVDSQEPARQNSADISSKKSSTEKQRSVSASSYGSTSNTSSVATTQASRSSFSLSRLLQSFVTSSSNNNNTTASTSIHSKRNRFFSRQTSSLDTEVVLSDDSNHSNHNTAVTASSSSNNTLSGTSNNGGTINTSPRSASITNKSTTRAGTALVDTTGTANSPKIPKRHMGNVFVALFNYKPREKDDLDIKAGTRVITLDTSNPDWWKGKCQGRIGYFPSNYVTKLNPGDRAKQVVSGLEVMEGDDSIKLLKDQIVIQEGQSEDGMVIIRTVEHKRIPCPLKYLTDVQIFY